MLANKKYFTLSNIEDEHFIITGGILNEKYQKIEKQFQNTSPGVNEVTFIPIISGEYNPLSIEVDNGVFVNLNHATNKWQRSNAVLESLCFSLKNDLLEMLENKDDIFDANRQINLIAGRSKSRIWPQLLADILESRVNLLELKVGSEFIGKEMLALKTLDFINDVSELKEAFKVTASFIPIIDNVKFYREKYNRYSKLVDQIFKYA